MKRRGRLAGERTAVEIETAGIPAFSTKEGRGGGTYACRKLVIAYATWISPRFHITLQ